jgi:hypothetical protein
MVVGLQVFENDMRRCLCPAGRVVLVVVDEAHKAAKDHAYCTALQELQHWFETLGHIFLVCFIFCSTQGYWAYTTSSLKT